MPLFPHHVWFKKKLSKENNMQLLFNGCIIQVCLNHYSPSIEDSVKTLSSLGAKTSLHNIITFITCDLKWILPIRCSDYNVMAKLFFNVLNVVIHSASKLNVISWCNKLHTQEVGIDQVVQLGAMI